MKGKITMFLLSCSLGLTTHAQIKIIPFGGNDQVRYDLDKGTYDVIFDGHTVIKDAYAVCRSRGQLDSSTAYPSRLFSIDSAHHGPQKKTYRITLSGDGRPTMQQEFDVSSQLRYFSIRVLLAAP